MITTQKEDKFQNRILKGKALYDSFKVGFSKEQRVTNDILKGTKSVLKNQYQFHKYIKEYSDATEISSFMEPNNLAYPRLKENSKFLIPLSIQQNKIRLNNKEEYSKNAESGHLLFPSLSRMTVFMGDRALNEKNSFKKRCLKTMSLLKLHNSCKNIFKTNRTNEEKRYNLLFADFFVKWHGNYKQLNDFNRNSLDLKNIVNENYSNLVYDEKTIFHSDYTPFLKRKLLYLRENKVENPQISLNSTFKDINELNIDIKLKSIKLIFEKINDHDKDNESNKNLNDSEVDEEEEKEFAPFARKCVSTKFNYQFRKSKKKVRENKKIVIDIPLSYVFLFYYNGIEFFKSILVGCVKFSEDFNDIYFSEEDLYYAIKKPSVGKGLEEMIKKSKAERVKIEENNSEANNNKISNTNNNNNTNINDNNNNNDNFTASTETKKLKNFITMKTMHFANKAKSSVRNSVVGMKSKMPMSSYSKSPHKIMDLFVHEKKTEIIHANPNLKKQSEYENKDDNYNHSNFNEFSFVWETPKNTYQVTLKMPILYFQYEIINVPIETYCDRNLFLYMFQNNFINFDYYILNYLLSLKKVRKIILSYLSYKDMFLNNNLSNQHLNNQTLSNIKNKKKGSILLQKIQQLNKMQMEENLRKEEEENDKSSEISDDAKQKDSNQNLENLKSKKVLFKSKSQVTQKSIFIEASKKVYSQLSDINESFLFFVTNDECVNAIVNFHSFRVLISHDKLNSKKNWEFYLNFRQMRYLNNVAKYESLDTFLPKIVKTYFEIGELKIDFSVFEDFDAKILNYEKKEVLNDLKNTNSGSDGYKDSLEDMKLNISMPFVIIEKYLCTDRLNNSIYSKTLKYDFLQNINKESTNNWPAKILEELKKGDIEVEDDKLNPTSGDLIVNRKNSISQAVSSQKTNNQPVSKPEKRSFSIASVNNEGPPLRGRKSVALEKLKNKPSQVIKKLKKIEAEYAGKT